MEVIRQENCGVVFYRCNHPAWAGARHAFSTRKGGVSPAPWNSLNLGANRGDDPANVRENFSWFCSAAGTDDEALVKNHQIHSDIVRPVTRADILPDSAQAGTYEADGLITDEPELCLTIFSGDCIPILLYDPVRRCIAALHAGWRGTAAGIAARGVEAMVRDYGCRAEHILAAIGPGIGPCCFETHADVPDGLRSGLGGEAEPFIRPLSKTGKFSVDLKGVNRRWLELAGLEREHIALCTACTGCDREHFWSHRFQGNERGSMAAVIQLEP